MFNPAVLHATVAPGRDISTHVRNELIFAQGDNADSILYIRKGRVKVAVLSKDGKEAVIALLGPDELGARAARSDERSGLRRYPVRLDPASAI